MSIRSAFEFDRWRAMAPARAKVSHLASFKRLVTAYADYP